MFPVWPAKNYSLYRGKAPGSENWTWQEQTSDSNAWNTKIIYNVGEPSLTVFPAQGAIKTGEPNLCL